VATRVQVSRDRTIRFVLWSFVAVSLALTYFCFHPFLWKNDIRQSAGATITLDSVSDFLIVVDYSTFVESPKSFAEMSFSLAWLNTLQQEIGPVTHIDAGSFESKDLSRFRCVILTQSASGHDAWAPKLRTFLDRGGTLVLEMPGGAIRAIASADGKGGLRAAQNITYAAGLDESFSTALSSLDLSNLTQVVGSAGPLDDATTYMTIDGVPVIYAKPYATGHVVTVDFNYGMLLTALQQGRPLDDFSLRNFRDSSALETSDLSLPQGVMTEVPLADLLERFLFYGVLDDLFPVVGFWPFFDGMDGAVIVTHRENGMGDKAIWMPEYEATFRATSTLFVRSPMALTSLGLSRLQQYQTDVGLAFDLRTTGAGGEPVAGLPFAPVWQRLTLWEQAMGMKALLGDVLPLISSQSIDGYWGEHYTNPFRQLSAAGFRADASYRAPLDAPGYAFGTGMPFMPIDTNGKVFNILEFPIVFPVLRTEEDLARFGQFLEASSRMHHVCIGITFDTDFFQIDPSIEAFGVWQSAYRLSSQFRHWVTGLVPFLRFSRARFNAELHSRLTDWNVNNRRSQVLRLETLAPETGIYLAIPKTIGAKTFVEARRGIHRVREDALLTEVLSARTVSVFGFDRVLLPLSKGFNAIDVIYD